MKYLILVFTILFSVNSFADYKIIFSKSNISVPVGSVYKSFFNGFESTSHPDFIISNVDYVNKVNIHGTEKNPQEGESFVKITATTNTAQYGYIEFIIPPNKSSFNVSFHYIGQGGGSGGIPFSEFFVYGVKKEDDSRVNLDSVSSDGSWLQYNRDFSNTSMYKAYGVMIKAGNKYSDPAGEFNSAIDALEITFP